MGLGLFLFDDTNMTAWHGFFHSLRSEWNFLGSGISIFESEW